MTDTSKLPPMPEPIGEIVGRTLNPPVATEFWGYYAEGHKGTGLKQRIHPIEEVQAYGLACYAAGRAQALEAAAKVCRGNVCENGAPAWVDACTSCSHDILALKDKA